ncbi:DUF885 domain-containing protein [Shewanella surugensis]|uniref:DUF885 domain-containing protein n=1 Tax=Shewanella surugensis TaxID=212020 RepID=A0ABT0LDD9_9GAMM|nr:DUF885 domain-containing protein [Shewanella surugensis]MCL1125699.1 DUF885 domain-containing protein [Shewanella surugensis]
MKKTALSLVAVLSLTGLVGCQTQTNDTLPVVATIEQDKAFTQFSAQFIDELWQTFPSWALYRGFHDYDGRLNIPSDVQRQHSLAFITHQQQALAQISPQSLSPNVRIDYSIIDNLLAKMKWEQETFKSWQWDPSRYNVAEGFALIINGDFASSDERLTSVLSRLAFIPDYYIGARESIQSPTLEHTQLAILQNEGALSVLSPRLLQEAMDSGLTVRQKQQFKARYTQGVSAIKQHVSWLKSLEKKLTTQGARSFRIGEALYEQKFAFDIKAGMTAKQLYQKALLDKDRVQAEMSVLTGQLWSKYFSTQKPTDDKIAIGRLINKLSVNHVKRDDFVSEIRQQIPELIHFVNEKNLITLDPNKPLIVRETPEYMQGFAGASVSAPGPYEKSANTYYNVTPLDSMSEASAESYLREYNHWILQILNIHEAIPGHYTQLVYANESPSLVKSLFGNGAMIEGWAVYAERMMLEQGYSDFEPEMWLMYYKWHLRVICNTLLDYSIQVQGMSEEEAINLMTKEAFQQIAEAEGKWRRATLSQVQLTSYYAGYRGIYDLREDVKSLEETQFDLKAFHERFLSYGSAPVSDIRQLMLLTH